MAPEQREEYGRSNTNHHEMLHLELRTRGNRTLGFRLGRISHSFRVQKA